MQIDDEIPLLLMLIYLFRCVASVAFNRVTLRSGFKPASSDAGELRERQSQVGSLAGAAHLLNDNTGVLR